VRSLYLRIFVTIGLTMMLLVAVSVIVSFHVAAEWLDDSGEALPRELIEEASRRLAEGGESALTDWLREQERMPSAAVLLVIDASGRELLGREIPPQHERRLRRMREWGQARGPRNLRPPRFMPRIVDATGAEYLVVPTPRRLGPLGFLGVASVRHAVLAFALVITAVVSFLLARSISTPIRGLRDASRALAEGRLEARVGEDIARRRDELGSLGRDFDEMGSRLQRLMASRQELLRNVSHELRTPLTRIRMAVELAREKGGDDEPELERVVKESEKLDQLIDQVLALAKVDHGAPEIRREPVDLSALVGSLVEEAGIEADAAEVVLSPHIEPGVVIQGDAAVLAAGIENVLRNALCYSPPGGRVEIALATDGDAARIRIRDHGSGVPETELPQIFEPFHRAAQARSPGDGGYGLGLAVTAGAARLHGGAVAARNHPAGGLEVMIELGRGAPSR
jgi:two-component system OmpR family sensor kinase